MKESSISNSIRLSGISEDSIVDGPGLRLTLFTQGCPFHCKGCHNEETWDPDGGTLHSFESLQDRWRENPLLDGITFSGGEPTMQMDAVLALSKLIKDDGLNIVLYTGSTYEALEDADPILFHELLSLVDYIIDGPFVLEKRSLSLPFRGSTNQRIIDVQATRKKREIVLL